MKYLRKMLLVFLMSSISVSFYSCNSQSNNKLRIGAVVDLSGYAAEFGKSTMNAIELLKTKYPNVEFFIEDSKADPKIGINAATKLININKVDILYCDLSTVSNAINPIAKKNGKILMATVYLESLLSENPLSIRNLPSATDDCLLLLNYLKTNNINMNRIAILKSNDEFGNSASDIMRKKINNYGGEIIFDDIIPEISLIKSTIIKVINKKPDVVFIGSLLPSVGNTVKELRQMNFTGEIITNNTFSYDYINRIAGEVGKGVIYQEFPKNQKYIEFNSNYKTKFGVESLPLSVMCYDGLSYLIDSSEKISSFNSKKIIDQMGKSEYLGLYGKISMLNREIKYPTIASRW